MNDNDVLTAEAVDAAWRLLPHHCVEGIIAYFNERRRTGDFLRAVLENDLMEAFLHADDVNRLRLGDYVLWLRNYAPGRAYGMWGSRESVSAWLAGRRLKEAGRG